MLRRRVITPSEFCLCLAPGEKFCVEQGLSKDFIYAVYKQGNDWEFILKIDALLETAAKLILRSGLLIKIEQTRGFEDKSVELTIPTEIIQNEMLEDFVDCLSMDGRTSLLKLLRRLVYRITTSLRSALRDRCGTHSHTTSGMSIPG